MASAIVSSKTSAIKKVLLIVSILSKNARFHRIICIFAVYKPFKIDIMAIIREVLGHRPQWGNRCFFAENAALVGNVVMGDDVSIWYGAVLRADVDGIRIGNRVNIQDVACVHQSTGHPAVLGDEVSLGHGAIVHGAHICRGALIGMNAVVLDDAVVGEGSIVAAGAVVLEGTAIGKGELWAGIPARKVKDILPEKAAEYAAHYMVAKTWYEG
ncbi:bacterial transferase hexapeptide repeat protein [Prevotella bivia]|nr:bacterial transferase hexapeptide repeat protein [Prevotella bivia]